MAQGDGHATTVTFGTSAFNAKLVSVDGWGYSREAIDQTDMSSTVAHTFLPSTLYDAGEISLTFYHDAAIAPPFSATAETVTIAAAGDTSNTWAASAFMTGYDFGAQTDNIMEATMTLKVTGTIST